MAIFNLTNKTGVNGITAFIVSSTNYECTTDPSTIDFTTTLYHSGAGINPVLGDIIYKNSIGTTLWTSVDNPIDRQIQANSTHLRVNTIGVMITTC